MTDSMEYKGYIGSVHYSDEDEVFHGKLEGIRDLVTYEGTDVLSLKQSFHQAVDEYIETCRKKNKRPEVPFKGSFNVRVGSDLHKRAAVFAAGRSKKLNTVVMEALEQYLHEAHC
ncbi:MAG: type II toxin-antitoxin system HicB family antitoxin [Bryobacteraceae bacterium]